MANPCFPSQLPKFPFKPEEIRAIWEHAKENYIDKGVGFDATVAGVSSDLGLPAKYVVQAFNEPKSVRTITDDLYRKMAARRATTQDAKRLVSDLDAPGYAQWARKIYNIPRSVLTLAHYAVFPVTHAGDLALRASTWGEFLKATMRSYRAVSEGYHEKLMTELVNSDNYTTARRGGLINDPRAEPQGILTSMSGPSRRAFDVLKVTRQNLFDREWNRLAPEDKNLDMSKAISDWANKATGAYGGKVPLAKFQFAPQLNAARWSRATVDPVKTVGTFLNWKDASPADRQVALIRAKKAGEMAATYATMLAVNQGLNSALGSKDKVNVSDSTKSDWLQFKVNGHVVGVGSGVMEVYRLLGYLALIGRQTTQERHGETGTEAAAKKIGRYLSYKLEPTAGLVLESMIGEDRLTGRPLPWSPNPGTPAHPKLTMGEYLGEHGPIPLSGGIREAYDSMRERGMSAIDTTALIKAAETSLIEATGVRYYPAGQQSAPATAPAPRRHKAVYR